MHDKRFKRLRDMLEYYSAPGNFSGIADISLNKIGILDDKEKKDIISFLLTLTDKNFVTDTRFSDPSKQ